MSRIIIHFSVLHLLCFFRDRHEREVHSSLHQLILFLFQGPHRKIPGESDSQFKIHSLFDEHSISSPILIAQSSKPSLYFQPKVRMYSNFERRTDIRTYEDKKGLFSGVSWQAAISASPAVPLLPLFTSPLNIFHLAPA